MTKVLIGMADENLESDLRSLLDELQDMQVAGVAKDTSQLVEYTTRFEPDLIFVHDALGPEPPLQVIRDLVIRRPGSAIVQVSPERSTTTVIRALEAGARSVVAYPFAFEDFSVKVASAIDWSVQMQQVLAGAAAAAQVGRGRVIGMVGAKGGVGVTTLAVHLAIDHHLRHPEQSVCVVDLDIEKGDVSALLDVRQSVSVADLAKVHQDLSANTVKDAVVQHETGIHLLLAPVDVRETEFVTADALRPIVALLRRDFDVVFVDAGGYVSPAQAAVVELADETVVVTTSDVLAVRAMRKRILAWEALGVTREAELKVLVNKVERSSIFPAGAVEQLTSGVVLKSTIPWSPRLMEPAVNERDPRAITEVTWWRSMQEIRAELGLDGGAGPKRAESLPEKPAKRGRRRLVKAGRDRGSIALENVGLLPLVFLMGLIGLQVAGVGLSTIWLAQASNVAAREYAVTCDLNRAQTKARETMGGPYGSQLTVAQDGRTLTLTVPVPSVLPQQWAFQKDVSQRVSVVMEPGKQC